MKNRPKKEYRLLQLVWNILLLSVLAIGLFSWRLYLQEIEEHEAGFYRESGTVMERTEKNLNVWLDGQYQLLRFIAEDPRVVEACTDPRNREAVDAASQFVNRVHDRIPQFENLPLVSFAHEPFERIVGGEKRIIRPGCFFTDTVGGVTIGKGGMGYSYIREITLGRSWFISEVYPSILRDNPILVISAPVYNGEDLVGAAVISPQMDHFTKNLVDPVQFGQEGYLVFMNREGSIIAHPDRSLILSTSTATRETYAVQVQKLGLGEFQFSAEYLGEEKLYYGHRISFNTENTFNEWYLLSNRPVKEIQDEAFNYFLISLFMLILMVLSLSGGLLFIIFRREEILKQKARKLETRARTDSLTGLYNRGSFMELLDRELQRNGNRPLTVIMADLDHFKSVNDQFGHPEGDRVIVQTAGFIQNSIREYDLAGRYGGEEFIIALIDTDLESGLKIAERIQRQIRTLTLPAPGKKMTASFGICQWDGESREEIVAKADRLLYAAKNRGRNRIEWKE